MRKRIVFFGSADYSLLVLSKLIKSGLVEITAIVSQPDRPAGRNRILTPTPVSFFAEKHNFPLVKPQSTQKILSYKPDLLIAACYGVKIPSELIKAVEFGGLNIHPSLLPKYRGAAPAEWTIINGEKETGTTILTLADRFDEGEIVAQVKEPVFENETAKTLYNRLFKKGADLLVKILPDFFEGKIRLKRQDNCKATFAPKFKKEDGKINWKEPPFLIERKIRAFSDWPGTWTFVQLKDKNEKKKVLRLKILKAHLEKNKLIIDEVQLEGKKPVSFKQFKTGYPDFKFI